MNAPVIRDRSTRDAGGLKTPAEVRERQRLREVCAEFESFFMKEILKGLESTTGGALLGRGTAGSSIQASLADDQFAQWLSRSGGMGLGQALYESLVRQMEDPSPSR